MASDSLKLSLQIVPHLPAKKISTRPAVRDTDERSFLDTSLVTERPKLKYLMLIFCHIIMYVSLDNVHEYVECMHT